MSTHRSHHTLRPTRPGPPRPVALLLPLFLLSPAAAAAVALWRAGGPRDRRSERGDVPGWVLITVMTAGLVSALWLVAGPQLESMLTSALSSVGR